VTVTTPSQLSLAVTVGATGTLAWHWTLRVEAGRPLKTGDWLSFTVTVNVHVLELPLASRAVLVTVVTPNEKAKPLAGLLETLVTTQLSLAVTLKVTLLVQRPGAAFTVTFGGQVITGGWVSFTLTVKLHVRELPLLSRAVLITVVTPTGKAKPLGGELARLVTAQLSLAVTLKVTLLKHPSGTALTVIFAGQVICGSWLSITVTVKVHVPLLPLLSRAVLVTIVVPTGKEKALAGTLVTLVIAQLSVAVTVKVTLLVHTPSAALTVRFEEQLSIGG